MECVSEAQVLGLLRDALDADQRAAVERHLDACGECLEWVTLAAKASFAEGESAPAPHVASELILGAIVGRYEILEPLGRGMYAARDGQLGRRVAIRFVDAADARSQIGLLREAQALARITQPNVLTVYDVGTFEGAVFVATELVEGESLAAWLARPRRWRPIVAMFVQAARGLAAVHAAALVHLDFKPASVLVGADGRARLCDFGVVHDDAADARADQSAFCAALHEALGARASGRVPSWLRDVVRRGRAPDPAQRYPAMTGVIAALERGLGRRRRRLIAGATGLAVAVVAATAVVGYTRGKQDSIGACAAAGVGSGWDAAKRAELARVLRASGQPYAEAVWQRAARKLDQFAASWRGQRRDACVAFEIHETEDRALYDRRTGCLEQHQLVFDAIVERLGKGDLKADQVNRLIDALPELDACVRPDAAAWPASVVDRARFAGHFQEVAQVTSLIEAGDYAEAARRIDPLVAAAKALGFRRAEADAVYLAGYLAGERGQLADGERLIEQALWIAEATHYDELVATASCELLDLVGVRRGHPVEARRFVELVRATAERIGSVTVQARAARAIGDFERVAGRFNVAELELGRALALIRSGPAADPLLVADLLFDRGTLDLERGNFAAAEAPLRQALALITEELGEHHPKHASVLMRLAWVLLELHREREAEAMLDRGIALLERAFGPAHPDIAVLLSAKTLARIVFEDLEGARAAADRGLAILEHSDSTTATGLLLRRGYLDERAGDYAAAERRYLQALEMQRGKLGEIHQHQTFVLLPLAWVALQQRDLPKARRWCEAARASAEGASRLENRTLPMIEACFGEVELAAGRRAAAAVILERALALHAGNEDHSRVAETQFALARALPASARARAIELARAARDGFASEKGFRVREIAAVDAWLRTNANATGRR